MALQRHWWMVFVLLLLSIFCYFDRFLMAIMVDPIKSTLSLSDFQIGIVLGPAFALAFAVFGFPAGWAVDRYSRRMVLLLGVTLWSISTSLCGLAISFSTLLAARIAVGIGEAVLTPAAYSLIADGVPAKRLTTAMALFSAGPKWGQAAAYSLGGVLLAEAASITATRPGSLDAWAPWQLVFLIVGLPGVLAGLLCLSFREPLRRGAKDAIDGVSSAPRLGSFLKDNRYLMSCLIAGFTLMTIVANAIYMWVPTYMSRTFNLSAAQYGLPLGAIGLLAAASFVVHGAIVDHLRISRGMQAAGMHYYVTLLIVSVPLAVIMFSVQNHTIFFVLLGIFQIIALPFMLFMSASAISVFPNALRGQLTATFGFVMHVAGTAISPVIIGAMNDFIFHDQQKIGLSLAIVTSMGCAGALVAFRMSIKPLVALTEAVAVLENRQA